MFRKTVRQVLEGTGWDNVRNEDWQNFMEKYGDKMKCKSPEIQKDVSYDELRQKFCDGYKLIIYQGGEFIYEFYQMTPFEVALCFCYTDSSNVEIFKYSRTPFSGTIYLEDLIFLKYHFEDFYIYQMDGSPLKDAEELNTKHPFIAFSKMPINPAKDKHNHIIMRYLPETCGKPSVERFPY